MSHRQGDFVGGSHRGYSLAGVEEKFVLRKDIPTKISSYFRLIVLSYRTHQNRVLVNIRVPG